MSQHDFEILTSDANTGVTFRAEVNAALQALASLSSGTGDPAITYPYQIKIDTSQSPAVAYMRKADNSAWVRFGYINASGQLIIDDVDKVDGYHASQTPTANTIPVANSNGKLDAGWIEGEGIPVGTILPFAGSSAPTGYLICDGSAVSRTTYAALFAVIGTTYGAGDGSTTFNLPNLKGRVPVGLDTTQTEFNTLGKTGGAKTHTLTISELPAHTHPIGSDGNHSHSVYLYASESGSFNGVDIRTSPLSSNRQCGFTSTNGAHSHGGATGSVGSGSAHNNLQPYITINYIIKY